MKVYLAGNKILKKREVVMDESLIRRLFSYHLICKTDGHLKKKFQEINRIKIRHENMVCGSHR